MNNDNVVIVMSDDFTSFSHSLENKRYVIYHQPSVFFINNDTDEDLSYHTNKRGSGFHYIT